MSTQLPEVLVERAMVLLECHSFVDLQYAYDHVTGFGKGAGQEAMQSIEGEAVGGGKWRLSADMRGNAPPQPTLMLSGMSIPDTVLNAMVGEDIDAFVLVDVLEGSGSKIASAERQATSTGDRIAIELDRCMLTRQEAGALVRRIAEARGSPLEDRNRIVMTEWIETEKRRHETDDVLIMHDWTLP